MKILLLTTTFNALTQAVYTRLKEKGHKVTVTFAITKEQMIEEIEAFNPQIILCPFLKSYIPKEIYENYSTYIFHPAPIGDRGAYSLDYALHNEKKNLGWGLVRGE